MTIKPLSAGAQSFVFGLLGSLAAGLIIIMLQRKQIITRDAVITRNINRREK